MLDPVADLLVGLGEGIPGAADLAGLLSGRGIAPGHTIVLYGDVDN